MIASHPSVAGSHLFTLPDRQFWVDGPNGRHLCLVFPVLGPDLSKLSRGIYSRIKPAFARVVSRKATQALAYLHSNGICHGGGLLANPDG
jgi:serine/threonine protein kinase